MRRCEDAVIFALVMHDLGWVTMQPLIGLPALLAALLLQTRLLLLSICRCNRDMRGGGGNSYACSGDMPHEAAVLAWISGGCLWTCSEYVFDGVRPAGVLANISFLTGLDGAHLYPVFMGVAAAIMLLACVWLVCLYAARCTAAARRRWRLVAARVPLVGEAVDRDATESFRGLPKEVYEELFLVPWIVMDTAWECINYLATKGIATPIGFVLLSAAFGVVSIILQLDCLRLSACASRVDWGDVSVSSAEVLWVLGNIIWMLQDLLTEDGNFPAYCTAVSMFAVGGLLMGAVVLCGPFEAHNPSDSEASAVAEAGEGGPAAAFPEDIETEPGQLSTSSSAHDDPAKKRLKIRRRGRKPESLWSGVALLPKDQCDAVTAAASASSAQDVVRLAAEEALSTLGRDHDGPVVLLNLGRVASSLQMWREQLPRVQPYYSIRTNADAKVLQLLRNNGCGFACATPGEIDMALTAGAGPDGIMLSEPCKPRMHLNYARQRGVKCMSFDSAAELQKIVAEFSGARLLLRIAEGTLPTGSCSSGVGASGYGAPRALWPGLLDAANAAGLAVVGISLHVGLEQLDSAALDRSLQAAREALQLLREKDCCAGEPALLDLGSGVSDATDIAFERTAGVLHQRLSHWLPPEAFGDVVIAADAGSLLGHGSTALLTKVVSRADATARQTQPHVATVSDTSIPAAVGSCASAVAAHLEYTVNEGIHGAFSTCLCSRLQQSPKPLLRDATVVPGISQPCSILGPSGSSLDVILASASLPVLNTGDWLLWRRLGGTASSHAVTWHYADASQVRPWARNPDDSCEWAG